MVDQTVNPAEKVSAVRSKGEHQRGDAKEGDCSEGDAEKRPTNENSVGEEVLFSR